MSDYTIRDRLRAAVGRGPMPEDSAGPIVDWLQVRFTPARVLDVGCGGGAFLRRFKHHQAHTIGLDIAPVWPKGVDDYRQTDLRHCDIQPFPKADMTLCAEVAEHLPVSVAETLVKRLCESAPVVVFGAGIPGQGGLGHVNEQWPSWWARLFARSGFLPHDNLRRSLWKNEAVAPWYCQDILIYTALELYRGLRRADPLDVVHPRSWGRIGPMGIWQRVKMSMNNQSGGGQ